MFICWCSRRKRKESMHINKEHRNIVRSYSATDLNIASSMPSAPSQDDISSEQEASSSKTSEEATCFDEENDGSWISWFCNQKGNEFFCEVDYDYILDDFNLSGLNNQVACYDYALDLVLDVDYSHDDSFTDEQKDLIEWAAEMLYGLIHARFIATSKGMSAMLEKYRKYQFGRCPRIHCNKQRCLPVGQSDVPRSKTVKIYCPKCEDIYTPQSKQQEKIDGAYFGTTFPHLFLMTYEHLKPQKASQSYVPTVFGFKVRKEMN
ncbi:hypothetical protein UlMin_026275 [Ulmus minor]